MECDVLDYEKKINMMTISSAITIQGQFRQTEERDVTVVRRYQNRTVAAWEDYQSKV